MKPVSPQAVSQLLGRAGISTVLWSDRFKVEGVSAQKSVDGDVVVNVDYRSRSLRDDTEAKVTVVLAKAGYRVTGSSGILRVSRA